MLQKILFFNAGFSMLAASIILTSPLSITRLIGLSDAFWLQLIALGLIIFSALVCFVAVQKTASRSWVKLIISQDTLWVLSSILVLIFNPWHLNTFGLVLVAVIAVIIGLFAWLQNKHLPTDIVIN